MKKHRWRFPRRTAFILLLLASAAALAIQRILSYAADPVGEKTCPPLHPTSPDDPAKTTKRDLPASSTALPWAQRGGTVNDASCVDATSVYGVVQVTDVKDIHNALLLARERGLKVSIAGVRHSMGGQAFSRNAMVLDMTKFNRKSLDAAHKVLTVQSGATWHDIQNFLHPRFAVKAMQSTDIFTVGGSISVNAHGMDHRAGAMEKTIRSMRVMLPDGSIRTVRRTENADLFRLLVGGYGLFGIILDADIEVTDNAVYASKRRVIDYREFPAIFQNEIAARDDIGLMYGHLSTAPQSFLREMIVYTYEDAHTPDAEITPLTDVGSVKLRRLVLNLSKKGSLLKRFKWFSEKYVEPRIESCTVSRAQAMKDGEACLVSRNNPMHDSVPYLKNTLTGETDILHEYFIPREQFIPFIDGVREILTRNRANVLNASVRVVHREDIALTYAPVDMFSVVLYLNQRTNDAGHAHMRTVTRELIDLTTRLGGRFFLPYQLHYTDEQLRQSYPEIDAFFTAKQRYDPEELLTNTWYTTYAKRWTAD